MIRGEGSSVDCGRVKANYSSDDTNADSNQSSDDNQPLLTVHQYLGSNCQLSIVNC
ncbi:MAG: hypothetical protein IIA88_10525 [Bacteroidetes bacterium]|nr:hypothetical protein [Bacteroidota bacterium]